MGTTLIGIVIIICVAICTAILVENVLSMRKDPAFHAWPSITRCRICDKRVFVWQRHERRPFNVQLDNPDKIAIAAQASGIVHKNCKGNPEFNCRVKLGSNCS